MQTNIPFNKPTCAGNEKDYVLRAMKSEHLSGDGEFTKRCRQYLENYFDGKAVLLTTSCTHALEMSAILLDIQPGDEVIIPSFTFVSTVNAFVLRGAKPVFADIRYDTKNIDEGTLSTLITSKTKAIVPVHYAGVACAMESICTTANSHGIAVVEDNAHGFLGAYQGRKLGTFGKFSTLSFHETKNVQCGEGGALVINAQEYVERSEIIREKGTNRSKFFRGQVDKYGWVDIGSSYLPSELVAAYLFGQLEAASSIQAARQKIWSTYYDQLVYWATENSVELPVVPPGCEQPYHMFYLMLPNLVARTTLINHLQDRGIMGVFHYLPLHASLMGAKFGYKKGDLPVTEEVSDRLLRLPMFPSLSSPEQERIIESILEFKVKRRPSQVVT
ncbi:MAG TPA: dTDP-4-amino-4,6-dideoxygalactose transaminase [Oculatellaceae cyanobacterium]